MAFCAFHYLRLLIAVLTCFALQSGFSQVNHSFLAFQYNVGFGSPIYYLPTEFYVKYKSTVSVDSNFVVGQNEPSSIKLWIVENNMIKEWYRLSSLEGIVLNEAKPFLKELKIITESTLQAPQPFAQILVDSLQKEEAIFMVGPDLASEYKFVLDFEACYLHYPKDSIAEKSVLDSISYNRCFKPLRENFFLIYPEINPEQVSFHGFYNEYVNIIVRLKNPIFDYSKLSTLGIYFRIEPEVRQEIHNITVFEERL
ncbi:MAG: hypothetical protein IPO32_17115 [Crocinitomicaceae bacterium]|jgi:hypothetical protein|nr:hypothetical protein [Crocinitomicaceae bacterium]MBK9593139.1 hypothetical protein [Crocinitomicaceae bacterium]